MDRNDIDFEELVNSTLGGLWDNYDDDLYWHISEGGFSLSELYFAEDLKIHIEYQVVAAAINYILIEKNMQELINNGYDDFEKGAISILIAHYSDENIVLTEKDIIEAEKEIKRIMQKNEFNEDELLWVEDIEEDKDDSNESRALEIIEKMKMRMNQHIVISLHNDDKFTKEKIYKIFDEINENAKDIDVSILYGDINIDEDQISFSIEANLLMGAAFETRIDEHYKSTITVNIVGMVGENLFLPDFHYSSFMETYRDMDLSDMANEKALKKRIEHYMEMTSEERRVANKNKKDDDEYGAILLYDLPKEEAIYRAKKILKSNPKNIEAQILIAGWTLDLEKRIDLLETAIDESNQSFDILFVNKEKAWWGMTETRPFVRAKFLLASTFDYGEYQDDAVDLYSELLLMNPNDNQGVRYSLMKTHYKMKNKKGIASLVSAFPEEGEEHFVFACAYFKFMKYGKGHKTENEIISTMQSNLALASKLTKVDFIKLLEVSQSNISKNIDLDEIEAMIEKANYLYDEIRELFYVNEEYLKYYKKVVKQFIK